MASLEAKRLTDVSRRANSQLLLLITDYTLLIFLPVVSQVAGEDHR